MQTFQRGRQKKINHIGSDFFLTDPMGKLTLLGCGLEKLFFLSLGPDIQRSYTGKTALCGIPA